MVCDIQPQYGIPIMPITCTHGSLWPRPGGPKGLEAGTSHRLRPQGPNPRSFGPGPKKGPAPVTPPEDGASASRFRAGERPQNGSPETSCLTSPPSIPVECLPVCLKGASKDMECAETSISAGWRTGANGVVESWDRRGRPSIPDPNQPSRLIGKGRHVRCGCCRL
jgi:hypothetical protein